MTDPLTPLWEALQRGTPRSKLRLLSIVCPSDHTLLEVYRGSDQELHVRLQDRVSNFDFIRRLDERPPDWRVGPLAAVRSATCRCGTWELDPATIQAQIATSTKKRVVADRRVEET